MGALYDELKFCEVNGCLLEGSRPRGSAGVMMTDSEYPRVAILFTCPPGDPPKPQGDVRADILVGFQLAGFTAELSPEDDADLTRYIDERFHHASDAWVFRVNFCRGLAVEPPPQREPPPPQREPAPAPFPPLGKPRAQAGFDFTLVTMAAIGVGLVLVNRARTR
jgi:hypothetical protein